MLLILTHTNDGGFESTTPFDYESKDALRARLKDIARKYIEEWADKFQRCSELHYQMRGKSVDEINVLRSQMFVETYEPYFIESDGFEIHITSFIVKEIACPGLLGSYNFSYFEPEIYTLDEWLDKCKTDALLVRQITPISSPPY